MILHELEFNEDFKKNLKEIWKESKMLNMDGIRSVDGINHTIGYAEKPDEMIVDDSDTSDLIGVTRNFNTFYKDIVEYMKTHDEVLIAVMAEYVDEDGELREDNSGCHIRIFKKSCKNVCL